jgi:hypothetical protein
MDEVSVTCPSQPSTRAIVADEAFCAQAAAVLMCEEEPIRKAFIGEPVDEGLAMVRWALSHQDDEGFDTAKVLTTWAQKRQRGAWSTKASKLPKAKKNLNGEMAEALVRFWAEHPEELVAVLDQVEQSLNGNGKD